ncbi:MAG: alpha/beta fold hydrolase [Bradymonadaceae bacterium]
MEPMEIDRRDRSVVTDDGVELATTTYAPTATPEAAVVINSAMAVHRRFYEDFAAWLAEQGFSVVTYDYRGTGGSGADDLAGCDASIEDWFGRDMAAIVEWTRAEWDVETLYMIGHSLGGQVMGLIGDRFDIDAAVTLSAQSGYWRYQYPGEEWKLLVFAGLIAPLVTRLVGYLPWSAVFGGEDIPKRVALQWAAGCRHPDYLLANDILADTTGFGRFSAPILAYSFDDDVWGFEKAVDAMMDHYMAAPVERIHITPEDVGLDRIGHFGFFGSEMTALWRDLLERLEAV